MVDTKEIVYKKAYTELNEVFKRLSNIELSKIPNRLIENSRANMDTEYIWEYDDNKKIEEQDFLAETKALIVEIYERYLCPEDKKEFWKKYDQICLDIIEKKKKNDYNAEKIFTTRESKQQDIKEINNNNLPVQIKKEGILKMVINYIKSFFKRNK